ncbi:DUF4082 domain-containing protein [Corallococcus sp. bb12-1]|uniref:DUF4082 domain-containing protein n=1 Tax=Corallococcus sp. bb12-1 TaxID=2996784 RepID=UPI002271CAA4|nr:DUF4082 domain-containing protein [Corallococcus sp. bb12-1]MCY1042074.1 DUF4082 domain-containing protein [Corallococcus sp. bb12-1]
MLSRSSFWITSLLLGFTGIQTGCGAGEPSATDAPRTEQAAQPLLTGERALFGASEVPAVAAANDSAAVELGMRFRSDAPGQLKGVRFYKGAGNTGTHTGSLWSATGSLLATATFQGETASGWQEVRFATPVNITADTNYVVSYHAPAGHYAVTSNGFASALDAPPLHAPASGTGSGNGLYRYGTSGFPTDSFQASNYWVDVAFQPNDTTPPTAPTNVVATPNSSTAIDLTWYASVDGNGEMQGNARAHRVYRGSQLLAELPGTTTSYRDTGLTPATAYTYTVRGRDAAGNVGPASATVTATTLASSTCNPCSLWNVVTGDPHAINGDATPAEVGLKFHTDVAGTVTKVRYYKSGMDTPPAVGHLWSATGTLLGTTVQAPVESGFGWRELAFTTPVSLAANTTYVVSYFAPGGYYAITSSYFSSAGVDMPPLHAPSSVAAGGNGVRHLNGSGFPSDTYYNANFWVDVAFVPATGDASPVDLSVQHDFPAGAGVRGQALSYEVTVTNHGTRAATNLSFDIPVPAGLAPYAFTPEASVGTCGYWVSNIMHCDITSLPAGQDAVIRMTLVPSVAGTFQFQATVTASETDNVPANNTSTLTIPIGPATNVVTFDTFDGEDGPLTGIHGPFYFVQNHWYLASPWGGFTTKSVSFNGGGMNQGELSIHGPRTVVGLDAFTWDAGATLTVSCFNQPTRTFTLTQGQVTHVVTNWQGTCSYVTLATSNGWDTNFDNIELSPLP